MNAEQILEEIKILFEDKKAVEDELSDIQQNIGTRCIQLHEKGISDRRISEHIGGELSRTRIQQLRTRYSADV